MPIKNLIHRFQPAQLYIILVLSICYFSIQLVLSHITHALTLLMASYHMLCNIFALTGCIVTIKHSKLKMDTERDASKMMTSSEFSSSIIEQQSQKNSGNIIGCLETQSSSLAKRKRLELKLRNTFGWTRIDILTMLIVCIILASLSFSLLVEALQTLVHIDHQDSMHLPIPVMVLGFVGMMLNGLTYLLIGGYTMHQGSFLHITADGEVVLDRTLSQSGELTLKADERQLSKATNVAFTKQERDDIGRVHYQQKRQGAVEMLRDVSSTLFVIVCGLIVYMAQDEEHTAKFIDPVLSIFSCVLLVSLSYPYMKESCLILLQTIPNSINMEIFERQLVSKFPEIISYHDLHIWQLSAHKYVATVHIKFQNPKLYAKIIDDVRAFFTEQGITIITIQPEFHSAKTAPSLECLVQCSAPECAEKLCCRDSRTDLREISISSSGEGAHATKPTPLPLPLPPSTTSHHKHGHIHRNDHQRCSVVDVMMKSEKCKSLTSQKPTAERQKLSALQKLQKVLHGSGSNHAANVQQNSCAETPNSRSTNDVRLQQECSNVRQAIQTTATTTIATIQIETDLKSAANSASPDTESQLTRHIESVAN